MARYSLKSYRESIQSFHRWRLLRISCTGVIQVPGLYAQFTSDVFIEKGGTEEYVSGRVISLEADLAEQRLILCTAGWVTYESCFGNWDKLIPVP